LRAVWRRFERAFRDGSDEPNRSHTQVSKSSASVQLRDGCGCSCAASHRRLRGLDGAAGVPVALSRSVGDPLAGPPTTR